MAHQSISIFVCILCVLTIMHRCPGSYQWSKLPIMQNRFHANPDCSACDCCKLWQALFTCSFNKLRSASAVTSYCDGWRNVPQSKRYNQWETQSELAWLHLVRDVSGLIQQQWRQVMIDWDISDFTSAETVAYAASFTRRDPNTSSLQMRLAVFPVTLRLNARIVLTCEYSQICV